MQYFLQGRLDLVKELKKNNQYVHYSDMVLILTATLSACASIRWPGTGFDKNRFIELLALHSLPSHNTTWVSIPALIMDGKIDKSDSPYGQDSVGIFIGDEIDLPIDEAEKKYPSITRKVIRSSTYSFLIYEWLRCGYSHEYLPHSNITEYKPSNRKANVSYISRGEYDKTRIMTAFHLDYLFALTQFHVEQLPKKQCEKPSKWWAKSG
ncbi:MAG: hypothetical protein VSS75_018755 [Candidatus Parabeggiatoa sp.]|nr:hypothetical protein [Candidatus Parabeggiatoa sp.]